MGNERSGRGGIPWHTFMGLERCARDGIPVHHAARQFNVDNKTVRKVYSGEHFFQREGRKEQCDVCGKVVDRLPCMFCSVQPLAIEPAKLPPADLLEAGPIFARDDTAEELYPALVESVRRQGMIQWPLVTEAEHKIILGERRVRAAVEAGLPLITCGVVRCNGHRQWDAIITEECLRVERSPIERGRMFAAALNDPDCGHTQKTIGELIGRSQSYVAQHVRLLSLPDYWRDLVRARVITLAHARLLTPHADDERLLADLWRETDQGDPPSVRAFREIVRRKVESREPSVEGRGADSGSHASPPTATGRKRPDLREIKLRYAADVAETLELRLDEIAELEDCESREEVVQFLTNFYWKHRGPPGEAAALKVSRAA